MNIAAYLIVHDSQTAGTQFGYFPDTAFDMIFDLMPAKAHENGNDCRQDCLYNQIHGRSNQIRNRSGNGRQNILQIIDRSSCPFNQ